MTSVSVPPSKPVPAAVPAAAHSDEISLRELYLVLKRRSPWIVGAAVLVALATFVVLATRPAVFVAEGTTAVARAPIAVEGSVGTSLRFTPEVSVTFETYQTLAFSRGVLEAVLEHHEAADLGRVSGALQLERIAGAANQPSTFLAVAHRVRSGDPTSAARAAEAWIDATVATVRSLMLENLDALESMTNASLERARASVAEAERALETARADRALESLAARIRSVDVAIAELERRRHETVTRLASRSAERDALEEARVAGTAAWVVLVDAPEVTVDPAGAVASLDARIAGLRAELEGVDAALAGLQADRVELAAARGDGTVVISALERRLDEALQGLDLLAAIEPSVAYVAQVAPAGVRVLSDPTIPLQSEPTRAPLIALVAALVTGFCGVVLALLAEAVRGPSGNGTSGTARTDPA